MAMRYGVRYGGATAGAAALAHVLGGRRWSIPLLALAAAMLVFFRDPERIVPEAPDLVVSPADGRVTAVDTLPLGADFHTRISIFLSLLDVHVTRAPVAGRIAGIRYRRGRFRSALRADSAVRNERNEVRIQGEQQPIMLVQIAGFVARRIVFWPSTGDWVDRGQRVGLIKFGSRVDVYLGRALHVAVHPGDRVTGGRTILARLPTASPDASAHRAQAT